MAQLSNQLEVTQLVAGPGIKAWHSGSEDPTSKLSNLFLLSSGESPGPRCPPPTVGAPTNYLSPYCDLDLPVPFPLPWSKLSAKGEAVGVEAMGQREVAP